MAQELKAHGFDLYYFNNKKQGEIDFVVEYCEEVLPIIVKSGKAYERHNAICNVLRNSSNKINKALVLWNDNIKTENKITYMPIYMAMFLEKEKPIKKVYKIDLEGLE